MILLVLYTYPYSHFNYKSVFVHYIRDSVLGLRGVLLINDLSIYLSIFGRLAARVNTETMKQFKITQFHQVIKPTFPDTLIVFFQGFVPAFCLTS